MLRFHRESGNAVTLVASMKRFTVPYGVCDVGEQGQLIGIAEKPAFDHMVSTGFYVVEPSVLELVPSDRLFHMTHLIDLLLERGEPVGAYPVSEGSWLDMGAMGEFQHMMDRLGVNQS